jgi:hypothetical protein
MGIANLSDNLARKYLAKLPPNESKKCYKHFTATRSAIKIMTDTEDLPRKRRMTRKTI